MQRKILEKLLYAESLGYAALRPAKTESNLFAYHLEQLLKEKLIIKHDRSYTLSPAGLALIDRLSQTTMAARTQPHIVTAIDLVNARGETLLFKRSFQPYLHRLGFPMGKIHLEETIAQAAARELQEKTGLQDIPLTHRGVVYIEATQDGQLISKVLYHVFHGEVAEALPVTAGPRGECLWADHTTFTTEQLMPGFLRIKELLATQPGLFFDELSQAL